MRSWRRWVGASLLPVMAVALTSCGSNAPVALPETGATLEGEVSYQGKTLHFGLVHVEGAGGGSAQGNIAMDGTYKVQNVPVGPVKIAVVTNPGMARAAQMAGGANQGPDSKGGKLGKVPDYVEVPKKYHDTSTSNLSYTVEKGTNKYDIVLPK